MDPFLKNLWTSALKLWRDRSGNVAILFGLALVPMVVGVGAALDYSRLAAVKTKLNNAADIATLTSVSKNAQPFLYTPTQAGVKKIFDQVASTVPGVTITNFQATVTPSITNMTVSVSYTATLPLVFGAFLGMTTGTVGGLSTATVNAPPYVNFYLLLDNSPSMGLGATATDISNLITLTAGQSSTVSPNVKSGSIPRASCAFACHQHTFDFDREDHRRRHARQLSCREGQWRHLAHRCAADRDTAAD